MESTNNWMKEQIITLLYVATGQEISYLWSFVTHLIPAERGKAVLNGQTD